MTMRQHTSIDRLELDLRGLPRELAEATARALGPALQQALAGQRRFGAPATQIDAGSVDAGTAPTAGGLARRIAERIAERSATSTAAHPPAAKAAVPGS